MKKWLTRGISVLMAGALLAGATGCGSRNATSGADSTSPDTAAKGEPDRLKVFANFTPAEPGPADKAFIELVEKGANVKLEFEVPPSTNYKERLQLMLVSGSYPDLVMFGDYGEESYQNAVETGVIVPVNKYLKNAPNIMKYTYNVSWEALKAKKDENIYGIPRTSITRSDGYIIRKDWLDTLGIKIPEDCGVTLDQFTDILRKFTFNDPDKNGKADTFGYAGMQDAQKNFMLVAKDPFGLLGWQESNGKYKYMDLQYSKEHDNYKKALEYTASLFKEGVIDPDGPVNSQKIATERFKKGINGVLKDFAGNILSFEPEMKAINAKAELGYIFIKNDKGEIKGAGFGTGVWGIWGITSFCKKPEAAVRTLDWMLSDEGWKHVVYGIEGITYKVENGKKVYDMAPEKGLSWGRAFMRRNDSADFFVNPSYPDEIRNRVLKWVDISVKNVVRSKEIGYASEASKSQAYMDYKKVYDQAVTKIMVGSAPVSDYDKILDGWYKAGGEDHVKELNQYIEKIEAKK